MSPEKAIQGIIAYNTWSPISIVDSPLPYSMINFAKITAEDFACSLCIYFLADDLRRQYAKCIHLLSTFSSRWK